MEVAEWALQYYELGWSVIPVHKVYNGMCTCGRRDCASPGKHPRVAWARYATERASREQVASWFEEEFFGTNIGLATGRVSNLVVIDLDKKLGGLESLKSTGLKIARDTPISRTGGGGYHLFVGYPEGGMKCHPSILPGVDIKADNGFVVLPPSIHCSGRPYQWLTPNLSSDLPPFDFEALLGMRSNRISSNSAERHDWIEEVIDGVPEGARSNTAVRLAGRYFNLGLSYNEVVLILRAWNERNSPPLPETELMTTIEWASRFEDSLDAESVIKLARRLQGGAK